MRMRRIHAIQIAQEMQRLKKAKPQGVKPKRRSLLAFLLRR